MLLTTIYAPELVTLGSTFPLVLPSLNTQPHTDDCSNEGNTYLDEIKPLYKTGYKKGLPAHPVLKR